MIMTLAGYCVVLFQCKSDMFCGIVFRIKILGVCCCFHWYAELQQFVSGHVNSRYVSDLVRSTGLQWL